MKEFEEYFTGSKRCFKDASAEIQEKIKRLCGIGKKLLSGNISQQERSYLWEKTCEILESNEYGYFEMAGIESALPCVMFTSSVFMQLPNGLVLEEFGSGIRFYTKEEALVEMEHCESCDADYIAAYEAELEDYTGEELFGEK